VVVKVSVTVPTAVLVPLMNIAVSLVPRPLLVTAIWFHVFSVGSVVDVSLQAVNAFANENCVELCQPTCGPLAAVVSMTEPDVDVGKYQNSIVNTVPRARSALLGNVKKSFDPSK
jgi:hypothetical protein